MILGSQECILILINTTITSLSYTTIHTDPVCIIYTKFTTLTRKIKANNIFSKINKRKHKIYYLAMLANSASNSQWPCITASIKTECHLLTGFNHTRQMSTNINFYNL